MKKLTSWLARHATTLNIVSTVLLILNALLIILKPKLWLQILRYAFAAACVLLAGWNIASLRRKM